MANQWDVAARLIGYPTVELRPGPGTFPGGRVRGTIDSAAQSELVRVVARHLEAVEREHLQEIQRVKEQYREFLEETRDSLVRQRPYFEDFDGDGAIDRINELLGDG